MSTSRPGVVVGISGPPGTELGVRVLEALRRRGVETHLVMTTQAERALTSEELARADHLYAISNQAARISSGSFPTRGMVVAPCDLDAFTAISLGLSRNLLERAADVTIKERRLLVLLVDGGPFGAQWHDMAGRFEGTTTDIIPVGEDFDVAIQRALDALPD